MASAGVLWDCEDPGLWAAILARHGEVLRARAGPHGPLEALDQWYREELPVAIQGRAEKHVTQAELERLLAWKLAKGRFRPRLQQLVRTNTPELVVRRSAAAFHLMPDVSAAVTELCALRGVGPATASGTSAELSGSRARDLLASAGGTGRPGQRPSLGSSLSLAVLAAGAPEVAAFMSDEAVAAVPGLPALRYTLKYYLLYLGRVQERAAALSRGSTSGCWTPQKLERALWTWTVGRKLCPDLLPDLSPCPAPGDSDGSSCVAGATQ